MSVKITFSRVKFHKKLFNSVSKEVKSHIKNIFKGKEDYDPEFFKDRETEFINLKGCINNIVNYKKSKRNINKQNAKRQNQNIIDTSNAKSPYNIVDHSNFQAYHEQYFQDQSSINTSIIHTDAFNQDNFSDHTYADINSSGMFNPYEDQNYNFYSLDNTSNFNNNDTVFISDEPYYPENQQCMIDQTGQLSPIESRNHQNSQNMVFYDQNNLHS